MPVIQVDSLDTIAFGRAPGARIPAATGATRDHWLRAVALGGQGRYASARSELDTVLRLRPDPVLASLALSTRASLLRQLGWHHLASTHDGRALAVLAGVHGPAADEARCDALTGLAADALGCGRLPLGFRLLDRCETVLDKLPDPWRQRIRLHWVTAEMSLASGDSARALHEADRAVTLADATPSIRHRVKSELLRAAATSSGPDPAAAADPARRVLARCEEHGLVPLLWAASMLLGALAPGPDVEAARRGAEATIRAAGGRFRET